MNDGGVCRTDPTTPGLLTARKSGKAWQYIPVWDIGLGIEKAINII